jgi:hypothetical protein
MGRRIALFFATMFLLAVGTACAAESNMDKFAKCLGKKKVTMYGAWWCPHCADQKKEFGQSFAYINYVECAVIGKPPNVQTETCQQMQIKKYPTWIFPDGERVELVLPLDQLAQKAGCPAPTPPAK